MNLELLTMEVRPRTPWESMDLAVRLAVSHWRPLLSSWLASVLPLFLIINIILLEAHPFWAFILVWLLKPLYDRVPLFVLSRAVFAEPVSWKDTLNAIPSFFKTGVFATLTLYRLDPGRAFGLPVRQLEGLQGKRRRRRMDTLRRGVSNREIVFFILCFHLEALITWGLLGLLLMMLPTYMAMDGAETLFMNDEPGLLINAVSMVLYFLVMMIVETLYVAGGFVLYLNRRIILEGWDIELIFRKLKQRQAKGHTNHGSEKQTVKPIAAIIVLGLSLLNGLYPANLQAATIEASPPYEKILPPIAEPPRAAEASGEVIKEVMAEPVFNRSKKTETLKYIGSKNKTDKNDRQRAQSWLTDIFESLGNMIAFIFEAGLWVLLLVAIYLLVKYRHRFNLGFGKKRHEPVHELPEMLFGLDLREESLPDDVAAQALQLFQAHNYRAALALLYRASLAYLVRHYELSLEQSATEGDCLELVTKKLPIENESEVHYFIELTRAWQLTAYGHRNIPAEQMEQLCLNWARYYRHDKTEPTQPGGSI